MLAGTRDQLIRRRTQLSNTIRGYAAEFGLMAAKGLDKIEPLLARIAADDGPAGAGQGAVRRTTPGICRSSSCKLRKIEAKLMAWHRQNELSRRLVEIPAIGPIGAALLVMKVPDPQAFRSGRDFAAWIGLTPKDHSTAGKMRLGVITRAGDEALRSVLVVGATAVIQQVRRGRGHPSPWLIDAPQTQAAQAGGRGAGQQDGAHRLEADGQRRTLQSRAPARARRPSARYGSEATALTSITSSAESDSPRAEAGACSRRADGVIDRSETRDTPWDPVALQKPPLCLELASRNPSWPAVMCDRVNRPDI